VTPSPGAAPRLPRIGPYKRPGDRRVGYRRAEDRAAHAALGFASRASTILARDASPPDAVGRILALVARTAGARRAAALVPGPDARVYTAVAGAEPPRAALDLAAWLDAASRRARHDRATAPAARVEIVSLVDGAVGLPGRALDRPVRLALPMDDREGTMLGLDFASRRSARLAGDRLPPPLLRQAAGALALAARLASDRGASQSAAAGVDERRRFVSTVAHELRTPLTGLSGYLDLLLEDRGADPAIRTEFLERSRRIVESMAELVNDLLEMSRIEAGSLDLADESISLADVLVAARDALEPVAASAGVDMDVRMPSRLRAAHGDRRATERIVLNLMGNAVKYTSAGGRVEVEAIFDGPVALVVVRDTGAGIPESERERVFQRFARLDRHRPMPGTGLGLPIARELASLMGGDIGLASRIDVGSAFCLALPGPTRPDPATVSAALARAVAEEATRLAAAQATPPDGPEAAGLAAAQAPPDVPEAAAQATPDGPAAGSPPSRPSAARVIHRSGPAPDTRG
jgi:signal transduction histidine kinase